MSELVVDCGSGEAVTVPLTAERKARRDADRAAIEAVEAVKVGHETVRVDLHGRARQALADNAAFLAIASPTNAQTLAQVRRLTRQHNAVIRLLLAVDGARDLLVESADV